MLEEIIAAIVAAFALVFVTEPFCPVFLPEATVPKLRLAGENWRESCWLAIGGVVLPARLVQPAATPIAAIASTTARSVPVRFADLRLEATLASFHRPVISIPIALPPCRF